MPTAATVFADVAEGVLGADPHPGQVRFILSPVQQILVCAGRGWGKSWASVARAIRIASLPVNRGVRGVIFSRTYKHATESNAEYLHELCNAIAENTGVQLLRRYHSAKCMAELVTGARIFFSSYERPDNARGLTFGWAAIEELTQYPSEEKALAALAPTVRGRGSHHFWYVATPKGKKGIVKTFLEEVGDGNPDFQIIHGRTEDAPHVSPATIKLQRSVMSKSMARQELDAVILRPANVVFGEFRRARHLVDFEYSGEPYSIGIDWGDSHPAFVWVAHTTIEVEHEGDVYDVEADIVFDEYVEDGIPWETSKRILKERCDVIHRRWGRPAPDFVAGDRAVKPMMSWASHAFPASKVRKMEKRAEQKVWNGVQLMKARLDPCEGPARMYFARHLDNGNPRGIVDAMAQIRRQTLNGEPTDVVHDDNITKHVVDGLRYLTVALYPEQFSAFQVFGQPRPVRHFHRRAA